MIINMECRETDEEIQLREQTLMDVCRLCLHIDTEFKINIFDRIDPNPNKRPLADRIFELYQVKISKDDGLPINICSSCLYHTEMFSDFRENVHQCERKLQDFVISLAGFRLQKSNVETTHAILNMPMNMSQIEMFNGSFTDQNDIVVIDPTKCYASSDEENDDDTAVEVETTAAILSNSLAPMPENSKQPHSIDKGSKPLTLDGPDGFRNIFFCRFCELAFGQREHCEAHETNDHDPVTPYVCNFCPFRCDNRTTIIAHIRQYHEPGKPFVCVQCNKNFGRRADLKKHAISHTGVRPFECNICGKTFSRKTNVTKHLKIHADGAKKPFMCQRPQCSRSFTNNSDLLRHEKSHLESIKQFECTKCSASFSRRDTLVQHERSCLRQKNNDTCMQPGASENMMISLNPFEQPHYKVGDMATHANLNLHKEYSNAAILTSLNPMGETGHVMIKQSLATETKFAIPEHMKEHVNYPLHAFTGNTIPTPTTTLSTQKSKPRKKSQKIFSCDMCPRTFNTTTTLKNHKNSHVNVRMSTEPFECMICHKLFKLKRELDRHSLIHDGNKQFQCSVCQKRFLRRDKLVRHEKTHATKKLTAALPESAFLPENLKRSAQMYLSPEKKAAREAENAMQLQQLHAQQQMMQQQLFRPQFYAEYDLNQSNT